MLAIRMQMGFPDEVHVRAPVKVWRLDPDVEAAAVVEVAAEVVVVVAATSTADVVVAVSAAALVKILA